MLLSRWILTANFQRIYQLEVPGFSFVEGRQGKGPVLGPLVNSIAKGSVAPIASLRCP
jgi:hypothetical protein